VSAVLGCTEARSVDHRHWQ